MTSLMASTGEWFCQYRLYSGIVNKEVWDCSISICQIMDFSYIGREYKRARINVGQLKHGLHGWEARDEEQVAWCCLYCVAKARPTLGRPSA